MKKVKYIALLRGVNVGGNNKISMPELKAALEKEGFVNVSTYINSGNILFDSSLEENSVRKCCEELIQRSFGLSIMVCIIPADQLLEALQNAPDWWNTDAHSKHNAIFVIPPITPEQICTEIGQTKPEYEQTAYYGRVIFWSAPLDTFSHTRWSKITQYKEAYEHITIRNANTTCKLTQLIKKCNGV